MRDEEIIEKLEREDVTLASFGKRMLAYTIDEILVSLLFVVIYVSSIPSTDDVEQTIRMIQNLVVYIIILKIIYQAFFVWMYGATLGKIFMKIKVISIYDLENPTVLYSILRATVRIISENAFYLGFIWAYLNPKRQTWHDKVAGTLVVNVF
ncbi:RDD family protein [Sulfurospirillum sp. 1307]